MTLFYLIRHGSNDFYSHTLVGRRPGIHLNDTGRREAALLAESLSSEGIQQIFSSPLERCLETAEPLARKLGLPIETAPALLEVEFGQWTGKTFVELNDRDDWKQWNTFRSGGRAPEGEAMFEVQSRTVAFIEKLRRDFSGQRLALFSHGDPLRAVLLYYLGSPLEMIRRLELSPASVSLLAISDWEAQIRYFNKLLLELKVGKPASAR